MAASVKSLTQDKWHSLPRGLRYILVGALNTGVGYAVFSAFFLGLGERLPYVAVLLLAHFTAVTVSFLSHRYWVFGGHPDLFWTEYLRFQGSYLWLVPQSLAINLAMVQLLGWSPWLAQAITMAFGVGSAFLLHRFVVFRSKA
jgi:putative flippase GtrA